MKIHVFPFSRRDGTPAAEMPDQVRPEVIRERVQVLSNLERQLAKRFYLTRVSAGQGSLGAEVQGRSGAAADLSLLEVLVEGVSRTRSGYVFGSDRWYMPVEVPGTINDVRQFVRCRAVSANRDGVVAERCEPETVNAAWRAGSAAADQPNGARLITRSVSEGHPEPADLVFLGIPPARAIADGAYAWPL